MFSAVYEAVRRTRFAAAALSLVASATASWGQMLPPLQSEQVKLVTEARDAQRARDRKRLGNALIQARQQAHPLTPWIDYWEIGLRLSEVSQGELDAFYARWPGSYVEDRLRNDWLLELGHRRDWKNFATDYARFQMRDDREVLCYSILAEHHAGRIKADALREQARTAWLAQREGDEGCNLLASTLLETKQFSHAEIWLKLRLAIENLKPRAARQAAALLGKPVEQAVAELQDNAGKYLTRKAKAGNRQQAELTTATLMRVAAADPAQAAELMSKRWEAQLPHDLAAWTWAQIGRQAAFKLQPEAVDHFERAFKLHGKNARHPEWSDETLGWAARAALRAENWPLLQRALGHLAGAEQRDQAWAYWRARALQATAAAGAAGDAQRADARALLAGLTQGPGATLQFYGRLAAEELGQVLTLPPVPAPLNATERAWAQGHAGLNRAVLLIGSGLRNEGVREWNYSLRGLGDRELLAAAQEACDREIWDRCINTSDRSKTEIDLAQRFPTPYRNELVAKAREVGVDPAYVYGLIRQESRFVLDARSHVGASGLMQVMPATAKWTAKKVGLDYRPELMTDRDFNLKIGASYLKLVLDDFGGSMAMAAAAYNAGPGRPRRWREGPVLDAAIWAENIPFNETRDYVKKVLTNAAIYAQMMGVDGGSLRARLGRQIGPRTAGTSTLPTDLP